MTIEPNSRAAFYLQHRAAFPFVKAGAAWKRAGIQVAQYEAAKETHDVASKELRDYWESLNKSEPKRYGPEGVELQRLRDARRRASDILSRCSSYVTAPRRAYPDPAKGLRLVGRVDPEGDFSSRDDSGWFTDPWGHYARDGSGLMWGVVYQLPARDGVARFVAGYEQGDCDGGPWLDLETVYTAQSCDGWSYEAAERAKRSGAANGANELARINAEKEREYQTAWHAGSSFASDSEAVEEARKAALELLKERRQHARRGTDSPAICAAIRDSVAGFRRDICEARENMARLRDGVLSESEGLYWDSSDPDQVAAFEEGACI